ncbi:MAG TPA: hypothetical protein VI911_07210 [Patescibacteria group bacterium]|nr:hypothetical protein [Patescibacteria group bacterium]
MNPVAVRLYGEMITVRDAGGQSLTSRPFCDGGPRCLCALHRAARADAELNEVFQRVAALPLDVDPDERRALLDRLADLIGRRTERDRPPTHELPYGIEEGGDDAD